MRLLADIERRTTKQTDVQKAWQDIVVDSMKDKDRSNKRSFIVISVLSLSMIAGVVFGLAAFGRQQDKYLTLIENQQTENLKVISDMQQGFIDFLDQYDLAEYSQEVSDGGDANFIGRDGDIINGQPKDKDTLEKIG